MEVQLNLAENILKHEQKVLFIVQEYLNKNRFFMIDDIIPFINVRLKEFSINLNQVGIRKILKSLIKKKMILEKSKFIRDDVLNNENRKKIYNFIQRSPGIYFNAIAKNLHLSNYILAWHIKTLINFIFIRSKNIDKHEVFFDFNLKSDNDEILAFLSKEKSKKIIMYLMKHQDGFSKTHLSRELKMHSTTVSNYVEKLEENGILLKKKLSNKTLYFLNERYYYEILRK